MGSETTEFVKEIKRIIEKSFRVDRFILYGSRAKGNWKEYSDYNILIVSPDFKKYDFRERVKKVYDILPPKADFDIIPLTPEEFELLKNKPTIVKEAIEHGIEI